MPEKKGIVTGFIQKKDGTIFGLNLDGEEYLYSFPDKRGEPWEAGKLGVGDTVRIEYSPYEKDGKTKQYIAVIERLDGAVSGQDIVPSEHGSQTGTWSYEHKDRLMCRESCLKTAGNIYAASIKAGHFEHHPPHGLVTDYAAALEKWCLEAVQGEAVHNA